MKVCRTCDKLGGGYHVQCTRQHKHGGCQQWPHDFELWKLWYMCRGLPLFPHILQPVFQHNKWVLELPAATTGTTTQMERELPC